MEETRRARSFSPDIGVLFEDEAPDVIGRRYARRSMIAIIWSFEGYFPEKTDSSAAKRCSCQERKDISTCRQLTSRE